MLRIQLFCGAAPTHSGWEGDGKQPGKQVQGALKASLRRLGLLGSHSDLEDGKQRLRSFPPCIHILVFLPASAERTPLCVLASASLALFPFGSQDSEAQVGVSSAPLTSATIPVSRMVPGLEQALKCLPNE